MNSEPPERLVFEVDAHDLVVYQKHHAAKSVAIRQSRLMWKRFYSMLGVAVMIVGAIVWVRWQSPLGFYMGVIGAAYFAMVLTRYDAGYDKWLEAWFHKHYRENPEAMGLGRQTLEIRDEGLYNSSARSESLFKWSNVRCEQVDEHYHLIHLATNSAFVIKDSQVAEGDLDTFLVAIKGKQATEMSESEL
ncbi:MAG: YcxB family protein [Armatimonadetes bacterium]|nr:YcxB family protein [Armatimonadota bacterium]